MSVIDSRYPADSSAVLRYAAALFPDALRTCLQETTIMEGFRFLEMEPYKDVRLFLMDEATCMQTGTYKSLDGCVTIAQARQSGHSRIAFSSGANAGRALTEYGRRAGIETFFFCPTTTVHKLPGELFDAKSTHLIIVEGTDRRVKQAAKEFCEMTGIPLVPDLHSRILASGTRGMFVAETIRARGEGFHWFAQAVCAGFGPIGLYGSLQKMVASGFVNGSGMPGFLGVQQAALSPIADAWARGEANLSETTGWNNDAVIEPSLYNTMPGQTYPMLHEILKTSGGDVIVVEHEEYVHRFQEYLKRVEAAGIRLIRQASGEPMEKAGLLAGIGVLKAIDEGKIRAGQSVLCSLSGGASSAPAVRAEAEMHIPLEADIETPLSNYVREHIHANSF